MLERLIESWLDSASERSYQSVFCQMLSADGHLIVHSTRHMPIEFGKDVVTVAPDKIPCAFQLKGNPGGRMTNQELRDVQPQLLELATRPLMHSGVPRKPHRCYLVTNGEVDEEAQLSLTLLNQTLECQAFGANRIELWNRGHLLEMANRLGANLWPAELTDLNILLELLVHRGDDFLPIDKFEALLRRVLQLDIQSSNRLRATELRRRITSAAVLTAVALRNFSSTNNHLAIATAWVLFITYVIGQLKASSCFRQDGIEVGQNSKRGHIRHASCYVRRDCVQRTARGAVRAGDCTDL
jgi:hypothetical protein